MARDTKSAIEHAGFEIETVRALPVQPRRLYSPRPSHPRRRPVPVERDGRGPLMPGCSDGVDLVALMVEQVDDDLMEGALPVAELHVAGGIVWVY